MYTFRASCYSACSSKTIILQCGVHVMKFVNELDYNIHFKILSTEYRKEEGNVLFNDTLNTFYLRLYGVGHMVKYHSDSEMKPAAATWAILSD